MLWLLASLVTWADPTVSITPTSETAEAAYFQAGPNKPRQPLVLNQPNSVDLAGVDTSVCRVVFTREHFLDRLVPYDQRFLETGFPGSFDKLEATYKLTMEVSPTDAKIYELNRSSDQKDKRHYLGQMDKGSLVVDRTHYYDVESGDFRDVVLLLEREGYEPERVVVSAKELTNGKRLQAVKLDPAPGLANLWRQQGAWLLFLPLGAVLGFVLWLKTHRSSSPESSSPQAVSSIGKYRIQETIGKGGMAEVFRAYSVEDPDRMPVALKLMHPGTVLEKDANDRFRREIKASLDLRHPNLAEIHDWGESEDGRLYLVSELLEGETLRDRMKRDGGISHGFICDNLRQLSEALAYLHERGYIHRDIKPDNIFLNSDGKLKLVDLGIVNSEELAPLTRTGVAIGTPNYMAPEQARGKAVPASDQYALGVMLFEMLAGERPFRGDGVLAVMHQHLSAPIPQLGKVVEGVSPELEDTIQRLLAKNPESRYPDVLSAVSAVCRALGDEFELEDETQAFSVE